MLLAQTTVFFPPWYFWLFVFGTVAVSLSGLLVLIIFKVHAEAQCRLKERELAARLIEQMVVQRKMSTAEIEQVLDCYWRMGSFWYRFGRRFKRPADHDPVRAIQEKMLSALPR